MSVEKQCLVCNKLFTCNRSHAVTCSSTCRGIKWRSKKEATVSMKLSFSVTHFETIKNSASTGGKSINQYVHDRILKSVEYSE